MWDWVTYIGREITCNQDLSDVIVNMYETNVVNDVSLPYKDKGAEMVNAKNADSSDRASLEEGVE